MTEHKQQDPQADDRRRRILKSSLMMGGYAISGGLPLFNSLALAQDEEVLPFTDMPEGFSGPPKRPGGVFFQDTRRIDDFYSRIEDQFYVVQHYGQPEIAPADWRLRLTGLVERPLELSLEDIRALPKVEIDAGFECGGNGAGVYQGLVGNARWGGTPLRALLQEAGLKPEASEVVFYGADKGSERIRDTDVEQAFARSLHRLEALDEDREVLLVYEMNGEALPGIHGAPLRVLVPGWYGVANVKWLEQIHLQDRRFAGKYMARDYVTLAQREVGGETRWEERLVTYMQLKSAITRVTRRGDSHHILGFALNDGTALRAVEVKIDDGPWRPATLDPAASRWSWKLFRYEWPDATPGEHTLVSRAIDVNGQVQATAEELPNKVSRWENPEQFPRTVHIS